MGNLKVTIEPLGDNVGVFFNNQQIGMFDSVEDAKEEYEFAEIEDKTTEKGVEVNALFINY